MAFPDVKQYNRAKAGDVNQGAAHPLRCWAAQAAKCAARRAVRAPSGGCRTVRCAAMAADAAAATRRSRPLAAYVRPPARWCISSRLCSRHASRGSAYRGPEGSERHGAIAGPPVLDPQKSFADILLTICWEEIS